MPNSWEFRGRRQDAAPVSGGRTRTRTDRHRPARTDTGQHGAVWPQPDERNWNLPPERLRCMATRRPSALLHGRALAAPPHQSASGGGTRPGTCINAIRRAAPPLGGGERRKAFRGRILCHREQDRSSIERDTSKERSKSTDSSTARYSRNQTLRASERRAGHFAASHVKRREQHRSAGGAP